MVVWVIDFRSMVVLVLIVVFLVSVFGFSGFRFVRLFFGGCLDRFVWGVYDVGVFLLVLVFE